jgi:hypothetical protein
MNDLKRALDARVTRKQFIIINVVLHDLLYRDIVDWSLTQTCLKSLLNTPAGLAKLT